VTALGRTKGRRAARLLGSAATLAAILACGAGPAADSDPAPEPAASAGGAGYSCREDSGCTEYTDGSRMTTLGLDYFRDACAGQWREAPCPRQDLLSACHVDDSEGWHDVTFVRYASEDGDLGDAIAHCDSMGGRLVEQGEPARDPGLTHPRLEVDGPWVDATMDEADYVDVRTMEGPSRRPYDLFRVELEAGTTYTVFTGRPYRRSGVMDVDAVRAIDPDGLDLEAVATYGPALEIVEEDAIMGNDFEAAQVVAQRSGPHAIVISSGFFGSEGFERPYLGDYEVCVRRGAQPVRTVPP